MATRTKLVEAALGILGFALAGAVARAELPAAPAAPGSADAAEPSSPAPSPAGRTGPAPAPERIASYTLAARLDEKAHRVTATGTIRWRNASRVAVRELYVHLYLNAFKNQRSLFLRSPFDEGRSGARAEHWGYIDVERFFVRELGTDLWPARTPGTPDDPNDETDVLLPLPRPVEPGETLNVEVTFSAALPVIVERTGHDGSFHFVAQWFPKLARLEEDGTWAHFSFHPQAEFYADFGDYDVTLDVPADAVVGATGRLVDSTRRGARRVERYQAGPVHDFAWVAWPEFREKRARVGAVDVRVLHPPDGAGSAELELSAIRKALPRFSRLYGEYPYPTLTVVHPPDGAAAAGGMEYPTLITTGGPWYTGLIGPRALESVTLHELLHQWFYGIVATDESRYPFLDEGITTYAELDALEALYGKGSAFRGFGLEVSATSLARIFAARRSGDVPVATAAASFPGFGSLAALVYSRTGIALETLARVYGRGRVERAVGRYAREHRFAHPGPDAFFGAVRAEVGDDAARVLELALVKRGRVDYVVRELQTAPERTPGGIFDQKSGRTTVPVTPATGGRFRGRVVVFRHGELELPVEIELVDADGARTRVHWDGHGTHRVVEFQGTAPLAFARIDPDHRVLLDDDLLNNAVAADTSAPLRTLERSVYLTELLLGALAP
ncbi:MAG TPA: M1 family metallopeptidase [Polyangiaceae bacterium]